MTNAAIIPIAKEEGDPMKPVPLLMRWTLLLFVATSLSGCLDVDRVDTEYQLNSDLSGSIRLLFTNIHSNSKDIATQTAEMSRFYAGKEDEPTAIVRNLRRNGVKEIKFEIRNKKARSCDAVISGKFDDAATFLKLLLSGGYINPRDDFRLSRQGKKFAMKFHFGNLLPGSFSLQYAGHVIRQNASHYKASNHRMTWKLGKHGRHKVDVLLEP